MKFKFIMGTEVIAEKPKGEYENPLLVIERNERRIKILSKRINEEELKKKIEHLKQEENRNEETSMEVQEEEKISNEERKVNKPPKQDQNDKFTYVAPDIKEKQKAARKQTVNVRKKKTAVIEKSKEKLKNDEISTTSSNEYENCCSDEPEAEEIDRDHNLEEKSDSCLRNEIIEWNQEMESYRFKSVPRIMPKHHKKIMEGLKHEINRIIRNFKKINALKITGVTDTQKNIFMQRTD
jgi:hypothetical protein